MTAKGLIFWGVTDNTVLKLTAVMAAQLVTITKPLSCTFSVGEL